MTTSISERATAYRLALRQALNDGHSILIATELAKKAARDTSNLPQQKPVVLTDDELRLIDKCELSVSECDRLHELDQAEDIAMAEAGMSDDEINAVNHIDRIQDELDKARDCISSLLGRLDEVLGVSRLHSYGQTPSWYVEAAAISCGINLFTGPCLSEELADECDASQDDAAEFAQAIRDHGDEPVDMGDFGAGTLADARRNAGSIDDGGPYNEGLGEEGLYCSDCGRPFDGHGDDCEPEIKFTPLRAIDIPATEHHNAYRLWFDSFELMNQFLAGRCLYTNELGCIKDEEGDHVGMWYVAELNCGGRA